MILYRLRRQIKFLHGAVLTILVCTLLPALYSTPDYQYHHRSWIWFLVSINAIFVLTVIMNYAPWDKGFTPLAFGIMVGSIISLLFDHIHQGAVENYWALGYTAFCLPDILYSVTAFLLFVRMSCLFIRWNSAKAQEA